MVEHNEVLHHTLFITISITLRIIFLPALYLDVIKLH